LHLGVQLGLSRLGRAPWCRRTGRGQAIQNTAHGIGLGLGAGEFVLRGSELGADRVFSSCRLFGSGLHFTVRRLEGISAGGQALGLELDVEKVLSEQLALLKSGITDVAKALD
jgi:hypothetical protein